MVNDPKFVLDHWEASWTDFQRSIEPIIKSGAVDIARLDDVFAQFSSPHDSFLNDVNDRNCAERDLPRDPTGLPYQNLMVIDGRYVSAPRKLRTEPILADAVITQITDNTELIVELGCGSGRNLFYLYCALPTWPLKYFACELTAAGRKVTELIAALDPKMDCVTQAFDYRDPDYSFIPRDQNAVFFTSHSVEQVNRLDREVFDGMLECTDGCVGVHLEPVGWQRDPELKDLVESNSWPDGQTALEIVDGKLIRNSARWALDKGHNTNLLEILDELETSGRIRIRTMAYDVFGTNPFNPGTLIVWEKV